MKKFTEAFKKYYPFTLPGNLLFYFSVYSLGRGFATHNFTAISISMFFLVFILAMWGWLFFCSRSSRVERIIWKSEGSIDSATYLNNRQLINVECSGILNRGRNAEGKAYLFLRYAMIVKGSAVTAGNINTFFSRRYRSDSKGLFDFSFYFPYPGTVSGKIALYIEDIFSLTRINVFNENLKDFTVVPGVKNDVVTDNKLLVKDVITKQRKYDNTIEKYLMREYVPGDLYRDINWKSSSRINQLFTKISPGGKEEANILTFIYLSSSLMQQRYELLDNAEKIFGKFVLGKYFREFFYTFIHRIKKDADAGSDCELRILVNGEECIVKEFSDLHKAGHLLAVCASQSANSKAAVDLGFLTEIPGGSTVTIFAENYEIVQAAVAKLSSCHISACYIPSLSYKYEDSKNYITCKRSSFVFSAFYKPFLFYMGAAASFFYSAFSGLKNSYYTRRIGDLPWGSVKKVEIRMSLLDSLVKSGKEAGN
ncbi:MAG: DUF58 domain-containing protein [Spirochaetes bacterium]|nr:DUF58 domain-containing protein [Spirochaetota bacterium]